MHIRKYLLAGMAGLCFLASASGQVNKSNLTGVVYDSSGSAIPGAKLRLVNTATGLVRETGSDVTGLYRFALLDFGTYRLEIESGGFKKFVRDGILLETGETTTLNATMEVGELTESVTVTGESPLLRTETGALGTSVNTQVIAELPLISRNPYAFLTLAAGVQHMRGSADINQWDNNGPSDFAAGGSESSSEFLLDGIPNMRIQTVSFSPPPEAVQEMRVQTNAFDAEYGHSGAAFVNVSTRGGTNELQGSVYWFHRNDNLNANSFFNNRNGNPKAERKRNTYGFNVGGPVYLPKLYDGRDRTHFHTNFEGHRSVGVGRSRAIVPSALERNGDFTRSFAQGGQPLTIFDPATTQPSGSGYVRSPFPGNIIPASRLDPVAVAAMKYYPMPNVTPTASNLENFDIPNMNELRWASVSARGDHQIGPAHNLFLRFGWNHRTDPSAPFYGEASRPAGNPTSGQDVFARGNIAAGAGYTWIVSPRIVMDVRAGFTRYFDGEFMFGEGFDIATLGFPASFANSIAFANFPRFQMSGDVQHLGAGRQAQRNVVNQYNPLVNFHTTMNRHALKYGFRYQLAQSNSFQPGRSSGRFDFNRVFTRGPDPTRSTTTAGHDVASFLLGAPASGFADMNASMALQNTYLSFYVQDDWKATNRLTLNLGLRFEHEGPVTERFNQGSAGFDFDVASPIESAAAANYAQSPIPELASLSVKGGLGFLNTGGVPRGNLKTSALMYAPRFGFAYRVTDWIVWRGGYGMFYVPNNVSNFRADGFSLATRMITSLDNNLTPFHLLSDPFPNGLSMPPGNANGLMTGVGQSLTAGRAPAGTVPRYLNGMSQQFSMGFQFVLPAQVSVDASYSGNVSQRLAMTRGLNQYPNEYLSLRTRLNASVPNPFYGVVTDSTSSLSQRTTTVSQLLRPFPHFTGLTEAVLPYGRSHYDSMQLQVTRRMAQGLYFGAIYTVSKLMEATSYLNSNDAKPERVISNSDRPQRFVVHGIYEMPFGKGRRFLSGAHPVVGHVLGGWQLNWVGTFQSGAALSVAGERLFRSEDNPRTVDEWFDVTQFVPQEPFTLRQLSSRIVDLRAAGTRKWDFTLAKSFPIKERVQFRFSAEFYNAFNTTHLGSPNTTVTNASFGRITSTTEGPREIQLAGRLSW
ncbi:MAG TPA: TonB-dependent receptor [Bryobacteraceae bacterium]|nr:TonB-dependent receptor [Bryobacteraceae bacterium]